jgi:hypothetical protein
MKLSTVHIAGLALGCFCFTTAAEYPVMRQARNPPVAAGGNCRVDPNQPRQIIKGFGFKIQSDSIASGNQCLPAATTSVPHDFVPAERARIYREMLTGFCYCRLAGWLYWRGLDNDRKYLQDRQPEQLTELRELLTAAGLEGVSFEYWSPAPFGKANRKFTGRDQSENVLRCFGKHFAADPDYHGDTNHFLKDFAAAGRHDLQTVRENGIPIVFWGLQNEPSVDENYSSCRYAPKNFAPVISPQRADLSWEYWESNNLS